MKPIDDLEAWARGAGAGARDGAAARRPRRIIPVASGKGGVGKTTFALNFALELSRHGRTVLVDLDTGTSSVRACVDAPVARDLYHFFRKGAPLVECVTPLPERLDPGGRYRGFGFVAAPRHYIEELGRLRRARRAQLIGAINGLPADFVVLDLRAGLDENVLAFLPPSNSGILVFTPHLPAATLAASDIVRAVLLRKLRAVCAPGSPLYGATPGVSAATVLDWLGRAEDAYDEGAASLDAFVEALREGAGRPALARAAAAAVDSFAVHFVLNMFDGVQESYERAVRPFVESLEGRVSGRLRLLNLGWVVRHDDFDAAARRRVPALLYQPERSGAADGAAGGRAAAEIDRLAARYLGARPARGRPPGTLAASSRAPAVGGPPRASRHLDAQLDVLARMYEGLKGASWRDNFRYVGARALHVLSSRRVSEFGDARLYEDEDDRLGAAVGASRG